MKENNFGSTYSMCVELSKMGDKESIYKLLVFYLKASKEGKKTAKTALRKTKNQVLVQKLIDEKMKELSGVEEYYQLLTLGVTINRQHYLYDYLRYMFLNNIDLKSVGFYKSILNKPLNEIEKKEIKRYIIEFKDFTLQLIPLVGNEYIEKLLDSILNYIVDYGISEELLKIISLNQDYLSLLQTEIRKTIISNPHYNIKLARYLDVEEDANKDLISNQYSLEEIYFIMKNKVAQSVMPQYNHINIVIQIINKEEIDTDNWEKIVGLISLSLKKIENIDEEQLLLEFLKALTYCDYEYVENVLISLYKDTRLYSNKALLTLVSIKSNYAYREIISFMLTSENRKERYKYAVKLLMSYPQKATSIYGYAKDLSDERLIKTLDEVAEKFSISKGNTNQIQIQYGKKMQILPHGMLISEILYELAIEIKADVFYSSVGFAFSSGLKLLYPLFKYMKESGGEIELICGALQNYFSDSRITKMDKRTAIYVQSLIDEFDIKLFTYEKTFYHGKFYYIGNKEKAYVVLGSSNISKTAYLNNYELDILLELDVKEAQEQEITSWYKEFKQQCVQVENLVEDRFEDINWESELDIYSSKFIHKMSNSEVMSKITALTDEDTKFRLSSWINFNPTEVMSNLGVDALDDYIVFLYADYGIAVFESFIPGNAYYTFKYYDFEQLLEQVSKLTKSQMLTTSNFVKRGYHVHDREKLLKMISRLFE